MLQQRVEAYTLLYLESYLSFVGVMSPHVLRTKSVQVLSTTLRLWPSTQHWNRHVEDIVCCLLFYPRAPPPPKPSSQEVVGALGLIQDCLIDGQRWPCAKMTSCFKYLQTQIRSGHLHPENTICIAKHARLRGSPQTCEVGRKKKHCLGALEVSRGSRGVSGLPRRVG